MLEPDKMYEAHREVWLAYIGDELPEWDALSWPEKDHWQERADELNEAREEPIHVYER